MAFTTGFWAANLAGTAARLNAGLMGWGPYADFPGASAANKGQHAFATDRLVGYHSDGSVWVPDSIAAPAAPNTSDILLFNGTNWVNTPASVPVVVRKTADETVNNSAVLQNDNHLLLPLGANGVWSVRIKILYTSSPGAGFKTNVTAPSGATFSGFVTFSAPGGSSSIMVVGYVGDESPASSGRGNYPSTTHNPMIIDIIAINGANAGNLQLQWAQTTGEVSDTKVLTNSLILAHKIA